MGKTQSLEYTLGVLRELHSELMKEVNRLGSTLGDTLKLRVMHELLGV
jgi:ophiobolin F synthase